MRSIATILAMTLSLAATSAARADAELERLDKPTAGAFGSFLSLQLANEKDLVAKIEPDLANCVGLADSGQGIILVPGPKLGTVEADARVNADPGAPLAYLFLSKRFDPIVDGQKVPEDKLRRITVSAQGNSITATALILTLRHVGESDYRLFVYGAGNEPIAQARLFPAEDKQEGAVDMHVQDAFEKQQTLVITLRGQYEASLQIANEAE